MKIVIQVILAFIAFILSAALIYLAFVFTQANFDITAWDLRVRSFCGILMVCFGLIASLLVIIFQD